MLAPRSAARKEAYIVVDCVEIVTLLDLETSRISSDHSGDCAARAYQLNELFHVLHARERS